MNQVRKSDVMVSWSSGKDSAYALYKVKAMGHYNVVGLLTTVNAEQDRVAMHGVRHELLQMQARAMDLPVEVVMLPFPCTNEVYQERVGSVVKTIVDSGVERMVFGDLFLEDIRQYREEQLHGSGMDPLFPLWQMETGPLSRAMIDEGFRAVVTCVDQRALPADFAGRNYDHDFLNDLPHGVDPCGEKGEFHTAIVDGPIFNHKIPVEIGERVVKDDFVFADVIPVKG